MLLKEKNNCEILGLIILNMDRYRLSISVLRQWIIHLKKRINNEEYYESYKELNFLCSQNDWEGLRDCILRFLHILYKENPKFSLNEFIYLDLDESIENGIYLPEFKLVIRNILTCLIKNNYECEKVILVEKNKDFDFICNYTELDIEDSCRCTKAGMSLYNTLSNHCGYIYDRCLRCFNYKNPLDDNNTKDY